MLLYNFCAPSLAKWELCWSGGVTPLSVRCFTSEFRVVCICRGACVLHVDQGRAGNYAGYESDGASHGDDGMDAFINGVALLPKFNGYSMIQVMVMWAVMQGVGFANHVWMEAVDQLKDMGGALVATGTPTSQYDNIKNLLRGTTSSPFETPLSNKNAGVSDVVGASLCLQVWMDVERESRLLQDVSPNMPILASDYRVRFGAECGNQAGENSICFGRPQAQGETGDSSKSACGSFAFGGQFSSDASSSNSFVFQGAFSAMLSVLNDQARSVLDLAKTDGGLVLCPRAGKTGDACPYSMSLVSAAMAYLEPVQALIRSTTAGGTAGSTGEDDGAWAKAARQSGWAMAGPTTAIWSMLVHPSTLRVKHYLTGVSEVPAVMPLRDYGFVREENPPSCEGRSAAPIPCQKMSVAPDKQLLSVYHNCGPLGHDGRSGFGCIAAIPGKRDRICSGSNKKEGVQVPDEASGSVCRSYV